MLSPSLRIATWNLRWAGPKSQRGQLLKAQLEDLAANILCITESSADMLPDSGHIITATADYGYAAPSNRRKVLLWSREPWSEVDPLGSSDLPGGRFIAGTTATPLGPIRVFGCCIPWSMAHVKSGRGDRKPWEDHLTYLQALPPVLSQRNQLPAIWLGDFNQKIPGKRAPANIQAALQMALQGWQVATAGAIAPLEEPAIDHIVHSPDLFSVKVLGRSRFTEDGTELSDHFGVVADFQLHQELSWQSSEKE